MAEPELITNPDSATEFTTEPWRPLLDLSIESFYAGDLAIGRWACECLLSLPDLPDDLRNRTHCNQLFYTPLLSELAPGARITPIVFETPEHWTRFNPSIAVDGDAYLALVRSSNYWIEFPDQSYSVFDSDGKVRTSNYLVRLSRELEIGNVRIIEDRTELPRFPIRITGFEDCRLIHWNGGWHAMVTTREHNPEGIVQLGLARLENGVFGDLRLLDACTGHHEKNWVPFTRGTDLLFLYSCRPTVILRYSDGEVVEIERHAGPVVARDFRGGSQAIEVDGGFLFVIHEVAFQDDGVRNYVHRFVFLDERFRITRVSTPFFFLDRSIEYCCGLARLGDTLAITFGSRDREAYVVSLPVTDVLAILRPVHG